ncbi:MAG: DUF4416 family protein [Nitrospirae bacterium]|nr:DUF4416 family protein [Nitrospirota bacterium]
MGTPREPEKALLFVGTLFSDESYYHKAKERLSKEYGEVLFDTESLPWQHTDYYREELGWPILRRFIAFKRIIDPSVINEIKLFTNELEAELSIDGKRKINLDPGYVTLSKVVLATTKNYTHRIYLGKGIYAEVTLYYKKGTYRAHEFTYRDYQSDEYIEIFLRMRQYLKTVS